MDATHLDHAATAQRLQAMGCTAVQIERHLNGWAKAAKARAEQADARANGKAWPTTPWECPPLTDAQVTQLVAGLSLRPYRWAKWYNSRNRDSWCGDLVQEVMATHAGQIVIAQAIVDVLDQLRARGLIIPRFQRNCVWVEVVDPTTPAPAPPTKQPYDRRRVAVSATVTRLNAERAANGLPAGYKVATTERGVAFVAPLASTPPATPKPRVRCTQHAATCSVVGCDKPHQARGWCKMHHMRWLRHGDPCARLKPRTTRPSVRVRLPTPCPRGITQRVRL